MRFWKGREGDFKTSSGLNIECISLEKVYQLEIDTLLYIY